MSSNDNKNLEETRSQLDEIEASLLLPQSKEYFRQTIGKYDPFNALKKLQYEAARSAKVNPRLEEIRQEMRVGANIEGSPTVALLIPNIPGIDLCVSRSKWKI